MDRLQVKDHIRGCHVLLAIGIHSITNCLKVDPVGKSCHRAILTHRALNIAESFWHLHRDNEKLAVFRNLQINLRRVTSPHKEINLAVPLVVVVVMVVVFRSAGLHISPDMLWSRLCLFVNQSCYLHRARLIFWRMSELILVTRRDAQSTCVWVDPKAKQRTSK